MIDRQGQKANTTGNNLERFIADKIQEAGYEKVLEKLFVSKQSMRQPIYASQFNIGKSIYGNDRKCDFILYHPDKHPGCLVIESKWQQVSGSVEEKIPFLVMCIREAKYESYVMLDGGGYSKGAETWLRSQVGKGNLKGVFNMQEFQKFVNNDSL